MIHINFLNQLLLKKANPLINVLDDPILLASTKDFIPNEQVELSWKKSKAKYASEIERELSKKSSLIPARASNEALQLRDQLMQHAKKLLQEQRMVGVLPQFEVQLNELLQRIINNCSTSDDYSLVCSDIEHFFRLLKLKNDLHSIHKYSLDSKENLSEDSILSAEAHHTRSGMASLTTVIKSIAPIVSEDSLKVSHSVENEIYFEITDNTLRKMKGSFHNKTPTKGSDAIQMTIIDLAAFPTKGSKSVTSPWKEDWAKLNPNHIPDILVVDITSSNTNEVYTLLKNMRHQPNGKPSSIITFSSNNKYAQGGVDLVSSGEIRIYRHLAYLAVTKDQLKTKSIQYFLDNLKMTLQNSNETTLSARNLEKVLEKAKIRRSLKTVDIINDLQAIRKNRGKEVELAPMESFDLVRGAYYFHWACVMKNLLQLDFSYSEIQCLRQAISHRSIHAIQRYNQYLYHKLSTTADDKAELYNELITNTKLAVPFYGSYGYMMLAEAYASLAFWLAEQNKTNISLATSNKAKQCFHYATSILKESEHTIYNSSLGQSLKYSNNKELSSPEEAEQFIEFRFKQLLNNHTIAITAQRSR